MSEFQTEPSLKGDDEGQSRHQYMGEYTDEFAGNGDYGPTEGHAF